MLRRSSHWPAKFSVKRCALGSFEHPLDLGAQDVGLRQLALAAATSQQLLVRQRRPQEVRQPIGHGVVVEPRRAEVLLLRSAAAVPGSSRNRKCGDDRIAL